MVRIIIIHHHHRNAHHHKGDQNQDNRSIGPFRSFETCLVAPIIIITWSSINHLQSLLKLVVWSDFPRSWSAQHCLDPALLPGQENAQEIMIIRIFMQINVLLWWFSYIVFPDNLMNPGVGLNFTVKIDVVPLLQSWSHLTLSSQKHQNEIKFHCQKRRRQILKYPALILSCFRFCPSLSHSWGESGGRKRSFHPKSWFFLPNISFEILKCFWKQLDNVLTLTFHPNLDNFPGRVEL